MTRAMEEVLNQTPGQILIDSITEALQAGDLETLMAYYHEDAVLVRFGKKVEGKTALRQLFAEILPGFKVFRLVRMEKFVEARNAILFEAMVLGVNGVIRVYDVFVLRQGKISHHFVGKLD